MNQVAYSSNRVSLPRFDADNPCARACGVDEENSPIESRHCAQQIEVFHIVRCIGPVVKNTPRSIDNARFLLRLLRIGVEQMKQQQQRNAGYNAIAKFLRKLHFSRDRGVNDTDLAHSINARN